MDADDLDACEAVALRVVLAAIRRIERVGVVRRIEGQQALPIEAEAVGGAEGDAAAHALAQGHLGAAGDRRGAREAPA